MTAWSLTVQHNGLLAITLPAQVEKGPLASQPSKSKTLLSPSPTHPSILLPRQIQGRWEPEFVEWDRGDYVGPHFAAIRAENLNWKRFRDNALNGESVETITQGDDRVIATRWHGHPLLRPGLPTRQKRPVIALWDNIHHLK